MPPWLKWLIGIMALVMIGLVIFAISLGNRLGTAEGRVDRLYTFIGSANGEVPTQWSGLLKYMKQSAREVRAVLTQHDCGIWAIENNKPHGTCPPGPPGTVPKDPPGGPP
jgi:hypothetical protein